MAISSILTRGGEAPTVLIVHETANSSPLNYLDHDSIDE